jgi:hypothetical protein
MKKIFRLVFMILLAAHTAHAEPQASVKGTHVMVVPPAGFEMAERFPGYMSEETGSSVMVSELPAPFDAVAKGLNEAGFRKQGMALLTMEETSYGAYKGVLASASQSARGVDFLKWLAVFGDEQTTYLVTASFPREAESELSELLKNTVMGARVITAASDPFGALTFRVIPAGDMKITKVIGNNMLLSKGGVFPAKGAETPVMVIGASASKGLEIPDRKLFAAERMQKISSLENFHQNSTEPIRIDGLDGFESLGVATDVESGSAVEVYQVILFDEDGYYVIHGITSEQVGAAQLPIFRQIAGSFTKTPPQSVDSGKP